MLAIQKICHDCGRYQCQPQKPAGVRLVDVLCCGQLRYGTVFTALDLLAPPMRTSKSPEYGKFGANCWIGGRGVRDDGLPASTQTKRHRNVNSDCSRVCHSLHAAFRRSSVPRKSLSTLSRPLWFKVISAPASVISTRDTSSSTI